MAEDYAATCRVKELLDEWDAEAARLEAEAHRAKGITGLEPVRSEVSAWRLRECIRELAAVFPDAKAWHEDGTVPASECDHAGIEVGADCPNCGEVMAEPEAQP